MGKRNTLPSIDSQRGYLFVCHVVLMKGFKGPLGGHQSSGLPIFPVVHIDIVAELLTKYTLYLHIYFHMLFILIY